MTYGPEDDKRNPEPWKTNYVRESYAREKHPDDEEIIQMRRDDFDSWLERHDALLRSEEPSETQVAEIERRVYDQNRGQIAGMAKALVRAGWDAAMSTAGGA